MISRRLIRLLSASVDIVVTRKKNLALQSGVLATVRASKQGGGLADSCENMDPVCLKILTKIDPKMIPNSIQIVANMV